MYIGRFAPTPSGRLHLGSITTALGAYLRAQSENGKIILRIEDLDTPRCKSENTAMILEDLEVLGFRFSGDVVYQSRNLVHYQKILDRLYEEGLTYFCSCTRHDLKERACQCFLNRQTPKDHASVRFLPKLSLDESFDDLLYGKIYVDKISEHIVLKRSDNIFAYNFACVIDDIDEGVTEIVRGSDLIELTPIQNLLYKSFNCKIPHYVHLPLIEMTEGKKYSKQNHAQAALSLGTPQQVLLKALKLLGQNTLSLNEKMKPEEILFYAQRGFDLKAIPKKSVIYNDLT